MTCTTRLRHDPIDAAAVIAAASAPRNGAVILFLGTVREHNDGRAVTGIEYSAYEAMAERELADIAREGSARFGDADVAIEHRLGELELGEASVAIAVGSPHRDDAYAVSRWVIEELKRRVPIWKREGYVDGTREWVNAAGVASAPGVAP